MKRDKSIEKRDKCFRLEWKTLKKGGKERRYFCTLPDSGSYLLTKDYVNEHCIGKKNYCKKMQRRINVIEDGTNAFSRDYLRYFP